MLKHRVNILTFYFVLELFHIIINFKYLRNIKLNRRKLIFGHV